MRQNLCVSVGRKNEGQLPSCFQDPLGLPEKGGQWQGVVVAGKVSFAVFAFGVVMKKRWVAHHQIARRSRVCLDSLGMHHNVVRKRTFLGIFEGLGRGVWFQLHGIDTG